MDRNNWIDLVKSQMPPKRWHHTMGVMASAVELAERFGEDPAKAQFAALLHDFCKAWPVERQRQVLEEGGEEWMDLLEYDKELWHGPVAAIVLRRDFGVEDEAVLDAVRWHTSGRVNMTKLDKIVCLADYIEPGREFPGVDRIRQLAEQSLEKALVAGLDSTISYLLQKGGIIYPLTVMTRNSLLREIRQLEQEVVQ